MRALFLAGLGFLLPVPVPVAEYEPTETFELVLRADAIVDGVVTALNEPSAAEGLKYATFKIDVVETLDGPVSKEMTIRAYVDWICAARYGPYAEGQRAILFLEYQRGDDGLPLVDLPLKVMGTGNDGECPVVDGIVLHYDHTLRGLPTARMNAFDYEYIGVATPRDQFVSAVRGLRNCFFWPSEGQGKRLSKPQRELRQLCSDTDLDDFMRSSPFAEAMVRDSYAYQRFVKEKR
jgi:hypothetical protein